ncbi:MAG: hypothetical protein NZ951_01165 [Dehalococcoidia bacterium]|nr:hypothetical protein [Dehalococcoidia bacterium]MDW8119251.1 hypothetical protein [Chloroflexota bacterium]
MRFERGDPERPKGHAVLYFHTGEGRYLATYLVVLPVDVDFTRYMPPYLAAHMGGASALDLSCFAFPPVPEAVSSLEALQQMAQQRDDDLLFGGSIATGDTLAMVAQVAEAVQAYARAYHRWRQQWPEPAPASAAPMTPEGASSDVGVPEVLYGFMEERERLAELARLVGKLRFAVEGGDQKGMAEAEAEVRTLARYLDDRYAISRLLEAVKDPSPRGARLAQWYLERGWKLAEQDWEAVKALEARIAAEEGHPFPP